MVGNKLISVETLNDALDQVIKQHNKEEIKELVTPDFAEGFVKGLKFVKSYIVNMPEVIEEEQSIVNVN
jgi:hypothetical protein